MTGTAAAKLLVREGYDAISDAYRTDAFALEGSAFAMGIDAVERRVPRGGSHGDRATYASWLNERGFRIDEQWFVPEGEGATPRASGPS
jgi:hypothetical protein